MTVSLFSGIIPAILIVDDDEVMRMLLRQFLEGEGYAVTEAEDGQAALERLAERSYDLVILDIAMPGIDGPGVCAHICSSMVDAPPVLMVTALDDEKSIERSYYAGAVDYIRKPLRWPVLKNRIRYILGARRAKQELELLSKNYEMILDAAANGICGVDGQGRISYINPAALKMLGYSSDEVRGRSYREVFRLSMPGSDAFTEDCCPFFTEGRENLVARFDEARMQRQDGTIFPVDFRSTPIRQGGRPGGGVLVFQDVTERQEAAELIRYMANHDPLTNLPNRNYFRRRLPQAISLAKRYGRILCLLFIDLDRFKPINDQFGHLVGDNVLRIVARRLSGVIRAVDTVARLGGDEFAAIFTDLAAASASEPLIERLLGAIAAPVVIDGLGLQVSGSIGVSYFPQQGDLEAEQLLRQADHAMYAAKLSGRNRCCVFVGEGDEGREAAAARPRPSTAA